MAQLPMTKADLQFYLNRIEDEVDRRKGKLTFIDEEEMRAFLYRVNGDRVE